MRLTFHVHEEPIGEPRHRSSIGRKGDGSPFVRTYSSGRADPFKHAARLAFVDAMGRRLVVNAPQWGPEAPARVTVEAFLARPKYHVGTRGTLTGRATAYPAQRGTSDPDNIGKALMDCLGPWKGPALAWADDACVVWLEVRKRWAPPCEQGFATVTIETLDPSLA